MTDHAMDLWGAKTRAVNETMRHAYQQMHYVHMVATSREDMTSDMEKTALGCVSEVSHLASDCVVRLLHAETIPLVNSSDVKFRKKIDKYADDLREYLENTFQGKASNPPMNPADEEFRQRLSTGTAGMVERLSRRAARRVEAEQFRRKHGVYPLDYDPDNPFDNPYVRAND